ncbi:MAG TPA: hypothetical protein VEP66_20720 [Myxococcales bacterium]|nr:hypothetical protein [Myxococcales bacterium]
MNPNHGLLLVLIVPALAAAGCGSGGSRAPGSDAGSTLGISLRSGGTVAVKQGDAATVQVDLTRSGYDKPVSIALAGLDAAGITADPLMIDASSSTGMLRLHASATAAVGTATGTVQGNGGDASASIAVSVSARAPASSLAIAVTPGSLTIPRGGFTTIQIDLTRNDDSSPVTVAIDGLSAAGIDSGETLIDAEGTTGVITLFASPTAPLGTTVGTVRANDGEATAPLTATVVAPGRFSLDFNRPLLTLRPRETTSAFVTVTRFGGFAGAVDVTVSGLPAGVTADPLTIGTENLGLLVLRNDGGGSAVSGVPITLTGTSGASSATTNFALTLRGIFVAVASRALFVGQGQTAGVAVGVATLASVPGPRTITVAGLPQGVVAAPLQIPEAETFASLLLTAAENAPTGTASLTVTATSGSMAASASFALTVEENRVRIASLDPASTTMAAGTSKRVVVELIRTGSFRTMAMPISASGLPAGITADPFFLSTDSSSGVLNLHAAGDAVLERPSSVTINAGTSGTDPCSFDCTVLASAQLPLTVVAPFDFAVDAAAVSLQQGSTSSLAVTLTRTPGFGESVVLDVGGFPAGVTGEDAVLDAGVRRAEIALAATLAAIPGDSVLTLTATGAGFTARHAVQLHVFAPAADSPSIASFVPRAGAVFVGERTQLTAVFDGDDASIDGIGAVRSGQAFETPVLSRRTTFTLRVRRGPEQVEAHVTLDAVYRNRFRQLAAAPIARGIHLAATLPDGSVLLMGGHASDALNIPATISTARFDPITERTTNGADLPFFAGTPETSSVQLTDGSFLLIGGGINSNSQGLGGDADRLTLSFGPADQRFVQVGNTRQHRHAFTVATPLLDGGALLTGGSFGLSFFNSSERFDPFTGHWSNAASMSVTRVVHTATRLADGRVLIAGGLACCRVTGNTISAFGLDTAEIYDPDTDQFTPTGSLTAARGFHTATALADGRVLIAGGQFGTDADPSPTTAEIYDPSTGAFSPAGHLQFSRGSHTAVPHGRVLVVGGTDGANPFVAIQATEIYDPATNSWSLGPALQSAFIGSTVTLLGNGKVLVFGGETPQEDPVSTVMLFE